MAFIAYDNLLDSAIAQSVLNSSALASGYSIQNLADNKTHTGIKFANTGTNFITLGQMSGPQRKVNTICIMGQSLRGSVTVQWSDDGITWTSVGLGTSIFQFTTFPNLLVGQFNLDESAEVKKKWWRLFFQNTDADMFISIVQFSNVTWNLQPIGTGFRPPVYEHYDSINAQGNAANYLGRSIKRKPMDLTIKQQGITQVNLRDKWVPFLEHAARKPFFFSWPNHYGTGATGDTISAYCWTEKPQQPVYSSLCSASINLKVKAIIK